ncbi:twin-arginine translocation signal domain-containing protein [Rubinisphaera italica]|uniref:NHL repeat protein n=1 Tax=Rubinisphaera italica TaxID=2527969 RepID=A0A5C5XEI6_9PLAN|nr:twin-arginine translocation signal domain-containing protein [Rubinisphaera italica]TWT61204.1 NHL repeat protein [Rubinisphaera italica]
MNQNSSNNAPDHHNKVSRRKFLQTTSIATAATLTTPFFVHAEKKSGGSETIIGSGEHTYRCIHNWGNDSLPADHKYGNASHGTAIDEQGLIYITHYGNPGSVFVFDAKGKLVKTLGDIHAGHGHGIDIRREGNQEFIYLSPSESNLSFAKITLDGEVVWQRGKDALNKVSGVYDEPGIRYRPTNISFRPDGGYYLGDGYGSNYLFEYDKSDKFVQALGGKGNAQGQFSTPHGHWLDTRHGEPELVVADRANKRLQWFHLDGTHAKTLEGFLFPADIDTQGDLMLVPDLHARITILDKDNQAVAQLGDDVTWRNEVLDNKNKMRASPDKWQAGKFVHPHDACFDKDGNIFVAEWVVGGRVTKLEKVS